MRKLQKILLGTFLGGVLLGGIGTGVAFVEYSSITYAGERKIGQESMVTKDFDFTIEPEKGLVVVGPVWYDDGQVSNVEMDETVPKGMIRYRVTYNEKTVMPHLYFAEYDEEDSRAAEYLEEEESQAEENRGPGYDGAEIPGEEADLDSTAGVDTPDGGSNESDAEDESAADGSDDASDADAEETERDGGRQNVIEAPRKKKVRCQGEIYLRSNHRDDFGLFMENKDEILRDLKEGRFASYRTDHITDVKILINPASADLIKQVRE